MLLAGQAVIGRRAAAIVLSTDHAVETRDGADGLDVYEESLKQQDVQRGHGDDRAAIDHPWRAPEHAPVLRVVAWARQRTITTGRPVAASIPD